MILDISRDESQCERPLKGADVMDLRGGRRLRRKEEQGKKEEEEQEEEEKSEEEDVDWAVEAKLWKNS